MDDQETKLSKGKTVPKATIFVGIALSLLAVISHFLSEKWSITMYIPAFFGIPLILCGLIALKDSVRKHAMHFAALIATLGFLAGLGRGVTQIIAIAKGAAPNLATIMVWAMTLLCGGLLFLCIRSFIAARKARQSAT